MDRRTIPVPKGAIGLVIGKGGANIKALTAMGARVTIDAEREQAVIQGPSQCVQRVVERLNAQIKVSEHKTNVATGYEHPTVAYSIIRSARADVDVASARFSFRSKKAGKSAAGKPRQLHVLQLTQQPAKPQTPRKPPPFHDADDADEVTDAEAAAFDNLMSKMRRTDLAGQRASEGDDGKAFYVSTEENEWSTRDMFYKQVARAQEQFKGGMVKVRFNVGTQYYYQTRVKPVPVESFGMEQLERLRIGNTDASDLRSEFSNSVSFEVAKKLEDRLIALGFELVATKSTTSCHLVHEASQVATVVRFLNGATGSGLLTFALLKSANFRRCFHSFVHVDDAGEGHDYRFKLIARDTVDEQMQRLVVAATRNAQWTTSNRVQLRNGAGFEITKSRRKDKRVYEGQFEGNTVRASIVQLQDEEGTSWEVAGTNVTWNDDAGNRGADCLSVLDRFCSCLLTWS